MLPVAWRQNNIALANINIIARRSGEEAQGCGYVAKLEPSRLQLVQMRRPLEVQPAVFYYTCLPSG